MSVHDHHAWDIRVRIVFQDELDKLPVREPRHREDDPKPEVAHAAVFFPSFLPCRHGFRVIGHVLLEPFRDRLRGQASKAFVGTDSLGGSLVLLTASPKTTPDGLADKLKLGLLIHRLPFIPPFDMPYVKHFTRFAFYCLW
jgi:hypothetical protein